MSNIVTTEELIELTGTPQSKRQIEVLIKHGIKFITRTDGKIKTTWTAVNNALSEKKKKSEQEPNLDFLRNA